MIEAKVLETSEAEFTPLPALGYIPIYSLIIYVF